MHSHMLTFSEGQFPANLEKSNLVPQCITILDSGIDSKWMVVVLPPEKERKLLLLIDRTLKIHHMPIGHLASVIGKLIPHMVACPFGKLHYRYLERTRICFLKLMVETWVILSSQQGNPKSLIVLLGHQIHLF